TRPFRPGSSRWSRSTPAPRWRSTSPPSQRRLAPRGDAAGRRHGCLPVRRFTRAPTRLYGVTAWTRTAPCPCPRARGGPPPPVPLSLAADLCLPVDLEPPYQAACQRRRIEEALG